MTPRQTRKGRMLDGALILFFRGPAPDAGYSVNMRDGYLYRNGEHQGYVLQLRYDREVLGWWIEYEAYADTRLGQITDLSGVVHA